MALNGFIYGVVDNNVFTTTGTNFRAILIFGSIDYGVRTNWLAVQRLGSEYNIFIEDNVFDYADGSNVGAGTIDSNSGAAFVFRYNTMTNSAGSPRMAYATLRVQPTRKPTVIPSSPPQRLAIRLAPA